MSDNPNDTTPPSPEEQERLSAQMRAPRQPSDPGVAADFEARNRELNAQLTAERQKREEAERRASDAEARELSSRPQNAGVAGRQIPILYTIRNEHANVQDDDDEIELIVKDINKECKDIRGFKELSVGDFLALNRETLDNEARARGFDRGSRYALRTEAGDTVSGYHLFPGSQVIVGTRDTSPKSEGKSKSDKSDK